MNNHPRSPFPRISPLAGIPRPLIVTIAVTLVLAVLLSMALGVALLITETPSSPSGGGGGGNEPSVPAGNDPGTQPPVAGKRTELGSTQKSKGSYLSSGSGTAISGISSYAAVLLDVSGSASSTVASKNADERIYPASMTKVMTLIVACEAIQNKFDYEDELPKLELPANVITDANKEGGSGVLKSATAGSKVSVKDLLFLLGVDSDTVSARVIAMYVGSGLREDFATVANAEESFVAMMNSKASSMGLSKTHFTNPTGLHHTNHYSTCREIASIMTYALDNPLVKRIVSAKSYSISHLNLHVSGRDAGWYLQWVGYNQQTLDTVTVKGGKTGYEDTSGYCLVSYAETAGGKVYVQVISGGASPMLSRATVASEFKSVYNKYAT